MHTTHHKKKPYTQKKRFPRGKIQPKESAWFLYFLRPGNIKTIFRCLIFPSARNYKGHRLKTNSRKKNTNILQRGGPLFFGGDRRDHKNTNSHNKIRHKSIDQQQKGNKSFIASIMSKSIFIVDAPLAMDNKEFFRNNLMIRE